MDAFSARKLVKIQTKIDNYSRLDAKLKDKIQEQKEIYVFLVQCNDFLKQNLNPVQLEQYNKIDNLLRSEPM